MYFELKFMYFVTGFMYFKRSFMYFILLLSRLVGRYHVYKCEASNEAPPAIFHKPAKCQTESYSSQSQLNPSGLEPEIHEEKPEIHEDKPEVHEEEPEIHEEKPEIHEDKPEIHEDKPEIHEKKNRNT
jgi:hypothetical protein